MSVPSYLQTDDNLLGAALHYAVERGWPVLPLHYPTEAGCSCYRGAGCSSPGKHPRNYSGVSGASVDPGVIEGWWRDVPNANIGIATSTFFAVDIDPRHGGWESFEHLLDTYGGLDSDCWVNTGGGGWHFYFELPPEFVIKNGVNKLGPGIDLRAQGGYVVAPPSLHPSGKAYTWERYGSVRQAQPWLLDLLAPVDYAQPARINFESARRPHVYAAAALRNEAEAVRTAPEGTRNDALNRAAFALGQLVGNGSLDEQLVQGDLLEAAREAGLSEGEARRTIASGLTAGQESPRPPVLTGAITAPSLHSPHDIGNGARFAEEHHGRVRWCQAANAWFVYDGRRWQEDAVREVDALAKATAEEIYVEAGLIDDEDDAEGGARRSNAKKVVSRAGWNAMLQCAKSETALRLRLDHLDVDPWLLNVHNGTLDLATGVMRPHDANELLGKLAAVDYDPSATARRWLTFLERVLPDANVRAYVQRAVGLSLTGDVSSQCLFLCIGYGANGKSTFLETIRALLGPYAQQVPRDTFTVKRGGGIPNDIARMRGVRFLSLSETEESAALDEVGVKQLTGGDTLTARHLYGEFFEFRPTAKPWLASNHFPVIRGTDEGIWRRLKTIPFSVIIPPAERDPDLPAQLQQELSGVLNWALEGLRDWQTDRSLRQPAAVTLRVEEYRANSDLLGQWLNTCTEQSSGAVTRTTLLYESYERHCYRSGLKAMSMIAFTRKLEERGYPRSKHPQTRQSQFEGLTLRVTTP